MPNPPPSAPAPRFRPRVLPTLAMLAAVALCVAAGRWQHARMQQKETLRAAYDAAQRMAPLALAEAPAPADWTALRYRPMLAAGEYVGAQQFFLDNKVHAGRAGYDVVTPLRLPDGRVVLVDRGWIAQGASRAVLPEVPPPAGPVTVTGRLDVPGAGWLRLAPEVAPGRVWQNLDPARFAAASGLAVLPIVVEQTVAPVPDDGLVRDWPAPDFGIDTHRIYMVQWYSFAALAVVLWVALNLRRPRAPRDD